MIVAPLHPSHLQGFVPDPRMKFDPPMGGYWEDIAARGLAWTIADDAGFVVGAAGLYRHDADNPRIAEMWALFSSDVGRFMPGITKRTLGVLEASRDELDTITAHVETAFPQAKRWVVLLGFVPDDAEDALVSGPLGTFQRYVWRG